MTRMINIVIILAGITLGLVGLSMPVAEAAECKHDICRLIGGTQICDGGCQIFAGGEEKCGGGFTCPPGPQRVCYQVEGLCPSGCRPSICWTRTCLTTCPL